MWRRVDKFIDREEVVGFIYLFLMLENLFISECLIETIECGILFNGKFIKILDGYIIEDKEDWKKDLCVVVIRFFKIRKKLLGIKNVFSVKYEIIKVKKVVFF